jgi:hypothetical protein
MNDPTKDSEPHELIPAPSEKANQVVLEKFFQLQSQELDYRSQELDFRKEELSVRREEIDLTKQESERAHEYAKLALAGQQTDWKTYREQQKVSTRYSFISVTLILLCLTGFIVYAMYLNKEQFVLDIIKVLAGALGGGGIGYAIGHKKAKKDQEPSDD